MIFDRLLTNSLLSQKLNQSCLLHMRKAESLQNNYNLVNDVSNENTYRMIIGI